MTNFIKTAFLNRKTNPLGLFPIILLGASGLTFLFAICIWAYQHFYLQKMLASKKLQTTSFLAVQQKHNPCLKLVASQGIEKSYRYCMAYAETGDTDSQLVVGVQTYLGLGTKPSAEKAMLWFDGAATQHQPQAQYLLSLGHEYGIGVQKDLHKALHWANLAAKYPYVVYTHHLGHLQRNSAPDKAHENLLKAATLNYAPSQFELGLMYLKGEVKQNRYQAFYWIQKAADNEYVPAYLELAKLYQQGKGTLIDAEQAFKYYSKAAAENILEAQYKLGMHFLDEQAAEYDPKQGLHWLTHAAKQNYTAAQSKIGDIYFQGNHVEKDIPQALAWWVSAAKNNDSRASFQLGKILETGDGVPTDLSAAIYWYLKSAEGNDPKAQLKLAGFYFQGVGVAKDPIKSFVLYSQASNQGEAEASLPLGYLYDNGIGTAQDKQKALYWYQRAAQQDNPEAWRALGLAYLQTGDPNQASLAQLWLEKANNDRDQVNLKKTLAVKSEPENASTSTSTLPSPEGKDPKLLFQLGRAMLNGNAILDVSENPTEGLQYMEQSAKEGLAVAALYLGRIYMTGEEPNVPVNYGKALNWLDSPARKGHSEAQYYLGQMFYQGLGVSKNKIKAYAWLNLAAAQGNDHAGLIRNQLAIELSPNELEQAQKLSLEYNQA